MVCSFDLGVTALLLLLRSGWPEMYFSRVRSLWPKIAANALKQRSLPHRLYLRRPSSKAELASGVSLLDSVRSCESAVKREILDGSARLCHKLSKGFSSLTLNCWKHVLLEHLQGSCTRPAIRSVFLPDSLNFVPVFTSAGIHAIICAVKATTLDSTFSSCTTLLLLDIGGASSSTNPTCFHDSVVADGFAWAWPSNVAVFQLDEADDLGLLEAGRVTSSGSRVRFRQSMTHFVAAMFQSSLLPTDSI